MITSDASLTTTQDSDNYLIAPQQKQHALRDWQTKAIKYFFSHSNKAIYNVITGAGKTYVTLHLLKRLRELFPEIKTLIVTPKNIILEQTWYSELLSFPGISPKDVGAYYGLVKDTNAPIVLTNMQSIDNIAIEQYDFIIFDEVHNYFTPRMREYISQPAPFKLGLSATINTFTRKEELYLKYFNNAVFKYDAAEALADGVLNPFNFISYSIELDEKTRLEYDTLMHELQALGFSGNLNSDASWKSRANPALMAKLTAIKKLVNNYPKKLRLIKQLVNKHRHDKLLVFSQFNAQTSTLYWELLDLEIDVRVVHSGIAQEERDKALRDFYTNKTNCILTTKVLDEGYNLPRIDTAIITATDAQERQMIQRMGRVLRLKNKPSTIYYVYVKDTIEEENYVKHAQLIKPIANSTQEHVYTGELI